MGDEIRQLLGHVLVTAKGLAIDGDLYRVLEEQGCGIGCLLGMAQGIGTAPPHQHQPTTGGYLLQGSQVLRTFHISGRSPVIDDMVWGKGA